MTTVGEVIRAGRQQRPGSREDARLAWWREARFGMFIHWGLYAIPAGIWQGQPVAGIGEWIMRRAEIPVREYEQLAAQFNPTQYDPAAWVALAKEAGCRYLVITAKHHDGFCLFDSACTDYDAVDATPYGRDLLQPLAAECARQGLRLGFYYSQTQDWHHPNGHGNYWDYDEAGKDFGSYIDSYVKPQVRELLTNYGPVCLIWFDTPMVITAQQSQELLDLVHELQPECLVCGRLGNDLGDYASAGDNQIPPVAVEADWEVPATINDTWGFKRDDHNWKSSAEMIRKLVDIVSKNGNYLLNVGPTAEGVIPAPSIERLRAMGAWLRANGEAIYGCGAGPLQGMDWCRTTARDGAVYVHILDWPAGGRLRLPGLASQVTQAALLASGIGLPLSVEGDALVLQGPTLAPDPADTVIALTLRA